jgi:hypothetical protein
MATNDMKTMDGNTAAAHVAYAMSDVATLSHHTVFTHG